jgi:capsule polysaccharide modification protein KpsS
MRFIIFFMFFSSVSTLITMSSQTITLHRNVAGGPIIRVHTIDISWVDYPYTASTCDVMYCQQRRHLYYSGENLKYYLTTSPRSSPFIGGQS